MSYDEFVGLVQQRAQLASLGDAVGAIRATFETFAERLNDDEVKDIASQLPREVAVYLLGSVLVEPSHMSLDEFLARIMLREEMNAPDAVGHARVVLEVVRESVSETNDVLAQLPQEFRDFIDSGSRGEFRQAA